VEDLDYDQVCLNTFQNLNLGEPSSEAGLKFRVFISRTLSDIAATTRIVAVYDLTDFKDKVNPAEDGLFFRTFAYFITCSEGRLVSELDHVRGARISGAEVPPIHVR
jgi:hypothetical protein